MMRIYYNTRVTDVGLSNITGDRENSSVNKRNRMAEFFMEKLPEALKNTGKIVAFAAGATILASYGCMNTAGKFITGDTDADTSVEVIDSDSDAEDGIDTDSPDTADVPDTYDAETEPDTIDVIEDSEDADSVDVEEEEPIEPVCFEAPTPLDPTVSSLLNNTSSQDILYEDSSANSISADTVLNVSMTGYPSIMLGTCPDDPNAVAFIAADGAPLSFERDVSAVVGGITWSAVVPSLAGEKCDPLTSDSDSLIIVNNSHQQVPKNADMGGVMSHAGFDLNVVSHLIVYEKDGLIETSGLMTVSGSDMIPANVIKTIVEDGTWGIDVETRAGDLTDTTVFSAFVTGNSSKEARVYPKQSSDSQMYGVAWDTSTQYWCSRCVGHETFTLVVPGDLLCKVADSCGCVGDGFDIAINSVSVDRGTVPPHLLDMIPTTDDSTGRAVLGVSALSDPASDHPSVTILLRKGSVGWDDGVRVNFTVNINVTLTSQNLNPDGSNDTSTFTLRVPMVDPWAWGTLAPFYEDTGGVPGVCGCPPVCSGC